MPSANGILSQAEEEQMDRDLAAREATKFATDSNGAIIEAREIPVEPEPPPPHPAWGDLTHRGNGERVIDDHGDFLRHAPGEGWYEWDGCRWRLDVENKGALSRVMWTLLKLLRLSGLSKRGEQFVTDSQGPSAWSTALRTAALLPPIATTFAHFDDGPHAPDGHASRLNVSNGTVNLDTGELYEHRREDMITKIAPVAFDPDAKGTVWASFLAKVQPNKEILDFLQRLAGYGLSGAVRDQIFPIFWGPGGNGKGTYLDAIRYVMGEYAATIPEDVLIAPGQRSRPHPTSFMIFRGLRLAIASETEEGETLALSTMKRLTGGDAIRARLMGKDFIEFEPTHKLVMMTNAKPRLRGSVTASLRRRIFFIPWTVTFGRAEADTTLKERLADPVEQSGILNWLLEGYRMWKEQGLNPPACVLAATSEYMADEDTLGQFVEDRLDFGEGKSITADHLYKAYRDYCRDVGETHVVSPQDFKAAFTGKEIAVEHGAVWKRTSTARMYLNVELRPRTKEDHETADQRRGWAPHRAN